MFKRNLDALKLANPNLAEKLAKIELPNASQKIAVEQAESKDLIILYNEIPLDNPKNPLDAARDIWDKFVTTELKPNDFVAIFGLGLGYILKRAYVSTDARIFLYEPHIEVLRFVLEYVDFSNELQDKRVFITNSIEDCRNFIGKKFIAKDKIEVLFNEYYQSLAPIQLNEFTGCILSACEMKFTDISTMNKFSKIWVKNIITNLSLLKNAYAIDILKKSFIGKTVIIAAAGPSLKNNIETIKQNREKFLIIAVNKIYDYLLSEGITPDFVVFLDAQYLQYTIKSNLDSFKNINVISSIHSDSYPLRLPAKNTFVMFCDNDSFSKVVQEKISDKIDLIPGVSTSAGVAYFCAKLIGVSKIIYCGLDLAFKQEASYADNSKYEIADNKVVLGALTQMPIVNVKSFDGKEISTRSDYAMFIKQLSEFFSRETEIEIFNTTDFGAEIQGMQYMPLDTILEKYNIENTNDVNAKITQITTDLQKDWDGTYSKINDIAKIELTRLIEIKEILQHPIKMALCDTEILNKIAQNIFLEQYVEAELIDILNIFDGTKTTDQKNAKLKEFFDKTLAAINEILQISG